MAMSEALSLTLAGIAGGMIGAVFFGGLWWTVQRGASSRQPAVWFAGGLLLRMGIALGGFYFVSAGHWERLIACLVGFVLARVAVLWLTRLRVGPTQEGSYAHHSR
jgi:F1F0 ATPase subunit 2